MHTTTVTYLPSEERPRLSMDEGRALLLQYVGVECERLRGLGRAAGATRVVVAFDGEGRATSSELAGSTGDSRVDGLVGAVTAQLRLEPPPGARAELHAGYRCTDEGGVSTTLERLDGA